MAKVGCCMTCHSCHNGLFSLTVLSGRHIVQPPVVVVVVAAEFVEMVVSVGGRRGVVMMLMDGDGTG